MKRERKRLNDLETYRILSKDIEGLKSQDIHWPPVKYGTIKSSPKKGLTKTIEVHYAATFHSSGLAVVSLAYNHPFSDLPVKQEVWAHLQSKYGRLQWRWECPKKSSKNCWEYPPGLWLGKEKEFSCQSCADIRRVALDLEANLSIYRKNVELIPAVLSNPAAKETKKRFALIALEKLTNKFKKMTKRYETLTFEELRYYKRLTTLLYPANTRGKVFKPSEKKGPPLPLI